MTNTNKSKYVRVKDKYDNDYLCPLGEGGNKAAVNDGNTDDCVEKDVVQRYSGNIDVEARKKDG